MNNNANQYRELETAFDLDAMESSLSKQLEESFSDLSLLEEERKKIGCPDTLGKVVLDVVWTQFMHQVAATAGEDFIKENHGLTLDLRDDAHIQTTENFAEGKIATHNDQIDFQKRYDDRQNNFQRNEDGTIKTNSDNSNYKGNKPDQQILRPEARKDFDKNRPTGSKSVHKDHTVPVAAIIRDSEANAHLDKQEQIAFANSKENLGDLDAAANASKSDSSMTEWLDSERDSKKPAERFNIDEAELRERDRIAREEYDRVKKGGEKKSIETGKQSQRAEAMRISNKALRAVVIGLLAALAKEIIKKLISWFRSGKHNIRSLLESIEMAIKNFVGNLKNHLFNAGTTTVMTIATAIYGPITRMVQKAITMLCEGAKSLFQALKYLKEPSNQRKPLSILLPEVGKIVVAGITIVGALTLGEVIEKSLMTIPVLAFEIPLLGSLANLIGILLGALIAGILGAIALNLIDKFIAKKKKREIGIKIIDEQNTTIELQELQKVIALTKLEKKEEKILSEMQERHKIIDDEMQHTWNSLSDIDKDMDVENVYIVTENSDRLLIMQTDLDDLL